MPKFAPIERLSGPDGTWNYLDRELDGLRDNARADIGATPVSDALAARLVQQILSGWSAEPAADSPTGALA